MIKLVVMVAFMTIIGYHVVYGVYLSVMNILNTRKMLKAQTKHCLLPLPEAQLRVVIVIPCWKEQKIIKQTIDHFSKFAQSEYLEKVLIVTSASETSTDGSTTYDIATDYIPLSRNSGSIEVIQCPEEFYSKPQKVNFAIKHWMCENHYGKHLYFCIYDADSRPEINSINEIAWKVSETQTYADIYQQVSVYCNNTSKINGPEKHYALADAIAQTHWSIAFEYSLYSEYNYCRRKQFLTPPFYLIGHGCFISAEYYASIGQIPELNHCDDAALGFLSGLLNADVQLLPVLDICDVAPTSLASVLQSRSWYNGSKQYKNNLRVFIKQYNTTPSEIQVVYWAVREDVRNFFWGWKAPLLLLACLMGVIFRLPYTAAGVFLSLLFFVVIPYYLTVISVSLLSSSMRSIGIPKILLGSVFAVLAYFGRCIGPFMGSLERKNNTDYFLYKTER